MFLALDQGTTSSRAIAYDEQGNELARAQHAFEQHFPSPGLVEHDAEEILATQLRAADQAWQAAGGGPVRGVGIANQRETVVLWERATGRPLHRAIVWQDRRTADALAALRAQGHEDAVRARTGLPLDPYFSAAKIAWLLDAVPGARARAERSELCAGTIDTWLLFRLTDGAVFATEPGNASRTGLFDLRTGAFADDLCALFRVPRACLPAVRPSVGDFGTAARRGWPLRAVFGDQQAALFGHGCFASGEAKCTYGTGAFVLANAGTAPPSPRHGLLATVAWRLGGATTYALEGSVLVCGAAVQWLRDALRLLRTSAESEAVARSVPDSGGVAFVPAFTGLGTPHWDPHARGTILGLTRGTTAAHVVRATIEAMALQVDDVLRAMTAGKDALALRVLRADGGAAANGLLLELQALLAGVPVVRPAVLETTAFGAFRGALLGAGAVRDLAALPRSPGAATTFVPGVGLAVGTDARALAATLRTRWDAAILRARGWSA